MPQDGEAPRERDTGPAELVRHSPDAGGQTQGADGVPQIRVREDKRALALLSPPWLRVDSGALRDAPVRASGIDPRHLEVGRIRHTLSGAQMRELAAWHEAAHAQIYALLGVPVARAELDGHAASGRVRRGGGEASWPLPYWMAGHLAGVAAGRLWLEREGLASAENLLLAEVQAASDHEKLFKLETSVMLIVSYGPRPEGRIRLPPDAQATEIDVDAMIEAVRYLLDGIWDAVGELAGHLLAHGTATDRDLKRMRPDSRMSVSEIDDVLDDGCAGRIGQIPPVRAARR
jgi:hypothetical protein